MLDEARHAVKDRLALVDLHAPQGVDAMADEHVRARVAIALWANSIRKSGVLLSWLYAW